MPQPASSPIPQGMHSLTAELYFAGRCAEAIEFYRQAFGAEAMFPPMLAPDGKAVLHAMLTIGDSHLMMSDAFPGSWGQGPTSHATGGLYLYVPDCDAVFPQAQAAGCEVIMPLADMFWGDRFGQLKDPFGHLWAIATNKWLPSPEEMEAGRAEWLKSMGAS